MITEQIQNELKQAINGLMMQSDIEAPFEVYVTTAYASDELNPETVLKLSGMPSQYPMQEMEPEDFFQDILQNSDANSAAHSASYQQLTQKLRELLHDVKVYRIGEQNITVFILGKTDNGEIAGLKTRVVQV